LGGLADAPNRDKTNSTQELTKTNFFM
jgi:hypothetical protein